MHRYLPPPLVVLIVAAVMWLLARTGLLTLPAFPFQMVLAGLLVSMGLGLMLLAAIHFGRHGTTVNPAHPEDSSELVTGGVYRVTRNPMYLGDLLILLGWGIFLASVPALIASGLFVLWIDWAQIPREEAALRAQFCEAYDNYCQRVRRWI